MMKMENFDNMMLKEILEEPSVFDFLIKKYIKENSVKAPSLKGFQRIKFVASGSSYNCARLGRKFFENISKMDASLEYSSEFNSNQNRLIEKDTLYFFISQSGETYDTKCALDLVKRNGGATFALVNNDNSYIYNNCDLKMNIESGTEKSIAATKSFTGGVLCLWLLALSAAGEKGIDVKNHLLNVNNIKKDVENVIKNVQNIDEGAKKLASLKAFPIIGYGYNYAVAKEGALKIKETSYIDVNAYPTGEFLHGHTAILNENSVILEVVPSTIEEFEYKTLEKIRKDFNPKIIRITDFEDSFGANADASQNLSHKGALLQKPILIKYDKIDCEITALLASIVVFQLLALKIAVILGRNVDKPIGLNKVVGES